MPRTPKKPKENLAPVTDAIRDHFGPAAGMSMTDIDAATRRLKRALVERMLGGELSHHLGYAPGEAKPDETPNHRTGTSGKTVLTDDGPVTLAVPRDRAGTFAPVLVPKHARRLPGFDDKVLALYARGLSTREIQHYLQEIYAIEVSPDLISAVTDAVVAEVTAWQTRPLEPMYPVVFFDALRVKIRDEGVVRSKAVHLALAVLPDGRRDVDLDRADRRREVLAKSLHGSENPRVCGHPHRRDGWAQGHARDAGGRLSADDAADLHRASDPASLTFAGHNDRKRLAAALRPIYTAPTAEAAAQALDSFEAGDWGGRFPMVVKMWRVAWPAVVPFFAFPPEVRRVMYTTNALENLNRGIRKIIKTRGHFPTDEAAIKLIWLAVRNITANWSLPAPSWRAALHAFAIAYGDRLLPSEA